MVLDIEYVVLIMERTMIFLSFRTLLKASRVFGSLKFVSTLNLDPRLTLTGQGQGDQSAIAVTQHRAIRTAWDHVNRSRGSRRYRAIVLHPSVPVAASDVF